MEYEGVKARLPARDPIVAVLGQKLGQKLCVYSAVPIQILIHIQTYHQSPLPGPLTYTTRTAAYAAVAANVSVRLAPVNKLMQIAKESTNPASIPSLFPWLFCPCKASIAPNNNPNAAAVE